MPLPFSVIKVSSVLPAFMSTRFVHAPNTFNARGFAAMFVRDQRRSDRRAACP